MKKVAILQSNYIPWKGYFDIIASVDEFILYDDMQYTRRDWRNRNKIKTQNGLIWLTIPVDVKGRFEQKICETKISDSNWVEEHKKSLEHNYSKAKFFREYKEFIFSIYDQAKDEKFLSIVNYLFITKICELLGIKTKISWSMNYNGEGFKTDRLISICKAANATHYLSGPSAKGYIVEEKFKEFNIELSWMIYSGYAEYEQLYPPFEHGVSILDLILNAGENSKNIFKKNE